MLKPRSEVSGGGETAEEVAPGGLGPVPPDPLPSTPPGGLGRMPPDEARVGGSLTASELLMIGRSGDPQSCDLSALLQDDVVMREWITSATFFLRRPGVVDDVVAALLRQSSELRYSHEMITNERDLTPFRERVETRSRRRQRKILVITPVPDDEKTIASLVRSALELRPAYVVWLVSFPSVLPADLFAAFEYYVLPRMAEADAVAVTTVLGPDVGKEVCGPRDRRAFLLVSRSALLPQVLDVSVSRLPLVN